MDCSWSTNTAMHMKTSQHIRKKPFDIARALRAVREAVRPYAPAALFELAQEGFSLPFEVLVSCIISIRTRDETTVVVARRLFKEARSAKTVSKLSAAQIDRIIRPCTFHEAKATQIRAIAQRVVTEYGGNLPCTF